MSFAAMLKAKYGSPEVLASMTASFEKHRARRAVVDAMTPDELRDEVQRLEWRFHVLNTALSTALRLMRPGYNDVYLELGKLTQEDP